MGKISIELEEYIAELMRRAETLHITVDELVGALIRDLLLQFENAQAKDEVDQLLKKHDEVLRRLARRDQSEESI